MKIYHYGRDGVYIGSADAREDPLDEGRFLIPANTTTLPPVRVQRGFAPVFNGTEWSSVRIKTAQPSKYHVWGDDGWSISEANQALLDAGVEAEKKQAENEALIQTEIRTLAIESLKTKRLLPETYEEGA